MYWVKIYCKRFVVHGRMMVVLVQTMIVMMVMIVAWPLGGRCIDVLQQHNNRYHKINGSRWAKTWSWVTQLAMLSCRVGKLASNKLCNVESNPGGHCATPDKHEMILSIFG